MKSFVAYWARLVIAGRWLVIIASTLAIGLSFIPIQHLYYDNSNENFFIEGDPALKDFNFLLERFGDTEYLSIGVLAPAADSDIFTPQTIAVVDELTQFLEGRAEVTQVRSLSKYEYTHSRDGVMVTEDLLQDAEDLEALAEARRIIRNEPLAMGTLVTEDLRHTRIIARVEYEVGSNAIKMSIMSALRDFIAKQDYPARGYHLHLSGQPVFGEQFEVLTQRDQSWINPTMMVLMLIIFYLSFRSLAATLLPWVMIGGTLLLVSGIQGLLGWPHTVVESGLVPTLIIIGVGVAVHLMVGFFQVRTAGQNPKAAAEASIRHLWVPMFFTALTTAAGFLALGVTELVPVRQFAWLGAIGAMIIFLLAMTLLPAVLSFVSQLSPHTQRAVDTGLVARITLWVPQFTQKFHKPLVALGSLLLVISLWLVPDIQVDTNFINYFKANNPTRTDLHYFDENFKGVNNIDLIIDSGETGGIHEPDFLKQVTSLQKWLEEQPQSGKASSLIRFHQQIYQALNHNDPRFYRLPETREMAAQFLLLYDNTAPEENFTDLRDFDERYLRIILPVANKPASETRAFIDRIRHYIATAHPDLSVQLTGGLVMYNAQDTYINRGMVRSFILALAIIGLCFLVLFRSLKYGLIALIPSIVPILMTGALLALLDIPLNLGTMIVGAMTMGIAVDDAIHVMSRYLRARGEGNDTHAAIQSAMNESGRAVIFTSIVLVVGFSVMLLGSFIPYIYTGLFAATIMALALLGDLIFLPAMLYLIDRKSPRETPAPIVLKTLDL